MWLVKTENSINLLDKTISILNKYNLDLNDVTVLFNGDVINASDVKEKLNVDYDNSWGHCNFEDIQLIVDDYTWFERTSYDGYEEYILKAHLLLSNLKNQESHSDNFLGGAFMVINSWFKKADRHINVCEICFEIEDYDYIVNSCFLAMFSVIKALLISKNLECKTHEGLIYLFKINFVDTGLFDKDLFKFYCKTKELNTEFFRLNLDIFNEKMAREVFEKTVIFVDYSKNFLM